MVDAIATTVVLLSIALIIVYGSVAFANWAEGQRDPADPVVIYDATSDTWAVIRNSQIVDHVTTPAEAGELLSELEAT